MLKCVLPLVIISFVAAGPAAARKAAATFGPPSLNSAIVSGQGSAHEGLGDAAPYAGSENLLTQYGIRIANGGARRPIAPNTELAVEPARGLVNEFGETRKPMRLLLRVGTSF